MLGRDSLQQPQHGNLQDHVHEREQDEKKQIGVAVLHPCSQQFENRARTTAKSSSSLDFFCAAPTAATSRISLLKPKMGEFK